MKLEEIKEQLEEKEKIEHNPFSNLPLDKVKEALTLLEEFSEEITFKIKEP